MAVVTAVYCAFPSFFVRLFMDKEAVVEYGRHFLVGLTLAQPFMCIDFRAVNVFQATGKGSYSLVFAILRKIVFEIPALILLNMIFPLYGLAYAQTVAELLLAIIASIDVYKRQTEYRLPEGGNARAVILPRGPENVITHVRSPLLCIS